MGQRVRWGILGVASIARRRFMPAIRKSEKSEAVAIGSRDPARAQEFAAEFDIAHPCGSYQEVLDDPLVEVVYIPLPNEMHAEWTMRAADAGKHILCEKPMAVDGEEARRMADHCRARGVILMEGFMYRLNPRTLKIKELIQSGALGELRTVIAQFGFTIDPSNTTRLNSSKGAGSLMDVGGYCINASRYMLGEDPSHVLASQRLHREFGGDMGTSAVLEFSGGKTALISCSFETAFRSSIEIVGTEGVLRAEPFFTPPNEGMSSFTVRTRDETRVFETGAVDQFLVETDHIADCVRGSSVLLLDPHKDAVPNAMTIEAIRQSAQNRCRTPVSP